MIETESAPQARAQAVELVLGYLGLDLEGERNALVQHDQRDRILFVVARPRLCVQVRDRPFGGGDLLVEGSLSVPGDRLADKFQGRRRSFHTLTGFGLLDPARDGLFPIRRLQLVQRVQSHLAQLGQWQGVADRETLDQHRA